MSIVSFNRSFQASVKLTGSSYSTLPFVFREKPYSAYTGSFDIEYKAKGVSASIREQTCSEEPDRAKDYAKPLFSSGVTESGYTNIGFPNFVEKSFLAETFPVNYGKWKPNTEPEIAYTVENDGKAKVEIDGSYTTTARVYVVENPEKFKPDVRREDQPIYLEPGIVTPITKAVVYEGDMIYIYPNDLVIDPEDPENFLLKIVRQKRYPKPDRVFSWTPNTSPVLTKGGYSDGELVKPGTIMIPTMTTSLREYDGGIAPPPEIPPDQILTIDYVYAGQGIMFDGDDWISLSGVPTRLKKKNNTYSHRNEFLHTKYIDPDQPHISLTERFYANRPIMLLSAPVDSAPSGEASLTAEIPDPPEPGPPPQDLTLELYSADRAFFYLLYDFGDAWSAYHQANKDWRDDIVIEFETIYTFGWGVETKPEKAPPADPGTGDTNSGTGDFGTGNPDEETTDPNPGTGDTGGEQLLEAFAIFAPSQTFRNGEVTEVTMKNAEGQVVGGSTLSITINTQFQG